MGDEVDDVSPVDEAVDRRLGHGALRRQIRAATDRLVEALGEEQHLWMRIEELLGEYRYDREAAYFDIGYEHGRAFGRAEGLAEGKPRATPAYRDLALRVREAAVNAGIPHDQAVAALLEATWALLASRETPRPRTTKDRE
ncbi:MAG: hypothetical protein HYZ28_10565 [Myxococcales bacterium]|nr:hypothetical protein [Myxococcales bacterium]